MSEELFYFYVKNQIGGYEFNNRDLLKQAFNRRSYTEEYGGENNEVLEFIGDKVLDIVVIRYLMNKYGFVRELPTQQEFHCYLDEGDLTRLKARMVEKYALSRRIEELGFERFLIMGKGDCTADISAESSVKEDLFEAIIGAVAIDSNWDLEKLESVVEVMLDPDIFLEEDCKNYVQLIQEWEERKIGDIPLYKYFERSYTSSWYTRALYDEQEHAPVIRQDPGNLPEVISSLKYTCQLKLCDDLPIFEGYGKSQKEARKNTCRLAYEWLEKEGELFSICDEIGEPEKGFAINQLEILARRNYFSLPTYSFREEHDADGNPIWTAICRIAEKSRSYEATSSSKKEAKKEAAYRMLKYVLE